ncbi:MAG: hypothetical protein R2802_08085 [Flavobacteriaceae bacterium]|nr:hypothetical protein [Mangrovimonas sp.]HRV54757.1 hypothetical protein [Mangrovimonas sp.]
MKIVVACLTLFLLAGMGFSQEKDLETLKAWALKNAQTTSNATLSGDYRTVLQYTLPSVLEMMGGMESAVALLEETFAGMKEQGFAFEKAEVVNVSDIVFEQEEYRCYVECFNQMKFNGMRIKSKSYLLGIYNQENDLWYFLEAKQLKNLVLANEVLPDFETNLVIPDDVMETEEIKE